jgi:hypothetical protein
MRKLAYLLVAIVILAGLAGGGYYGALFYAGSRLRAALDDSLTRLPPGWKASYKDVRVATLFPRTLVVNGMELHRTGDVPVDATIDELTFLNPPWDAPDPTAVARLADTMTFKGMVMHADGDAVKIAAIQIAGPRRYPAAPAPAAPAPGLPPELAQALADFDQTGFDSVTVDDIAILSPANGSDAAGAIKQITIGALDHGALNGAIAMTGFTMHGPAADKSVVSLDRFEIDHPNFRIMSDWQQAAADPSKLAPETALPLVQSVTMKGLLIDIAEPGADGAAPTNGKVKLDSAQLTNLRLYPAVWLKDGGQATFEQAAQALANPPETFDLDSLLPLLRSEAATLLSFGYGATVDGIDANIAVPEDDTVEHVTYKLRHAETVNYERGRLEKSVAEGLSTKIDPGFDSSIDKMELTGLDLRATCQRLAAGAPLEPSLLDGMSLARFAYSGISVRTAELGQPMTLGSIALSNIAFSHGLPASMDFAIDSAKVSKAQMTDPDAIDGFTKMGLDTLTMSFGAGYKWDPAKQAASIHDLALKIDELGALALSVDFTGVDKPETLAETAKLKGALLRYSDASLTRRVLALAAQDAGADPAAFRKQLATMIQAQAKTVLGTSPAATAATGAVLAFLADPHALTVQLAPAQPLGFDAIDQLQAGPPAKMFQALGVKVTANPAAGK